MDRSQAESTCSEFIGIRRVAIFSSPRWLTSFAEDSATAFSPLLLRGPLKPRSARRNRFRRASTIHPLRRTPAGHPVTRTGLRGVAAVSILVRRRAARPGLGWTGALVLGWSNRDLTRATNGMLLTGTDLTLGPAWLTPWHGQCPVSPPSLPFPLGTAAAQAACQGLVRLL